MISERNAFIKSLELNNYDAEERKKAVQSIDASDLRLGGMKVPFSYIPLFVNEEDVSFFNSVIDKTHSVLYKMTQHFIDDPAYRKIFDFSPELEELICLPCNYKEMIPVGRYDIFFDETTKEFSFCEFNTDGSGGMSVDYEVSSAILREFSDKGLIRDFKLSPLNIIDNIADALIDIYKASDNPVDAPVFAIVDYKEEGVMCDFIRFIEAFRKRGIDARFTDMRDLHFDGESLVDKTDGQVIHGIYRRAVTSVILERMDESAALIDAVKQKKVVLMGHFRTSLAHSKMVNAAMHHPATMAFLSGDDIDFIKKHVPETYRLEKEFLNGEAASGSDTAGILDKIIENKDDWVIKPREGFSNFGVHCGIDIEKPEWKKLVLDSMDTGYIAQKFCKRGYVPVLGAGHDKPCDYALMLGIFQAGGKVAGFYSRAGKRGLIELSKEGLAVSTLYSKENPAVVSIESYLRLGCKAEGVLNLGVESEYFIVDDKTLETITYWGMASNAASGTIPGDLSETAYGNHPGMDLIKGKGKARKNSKSIESVLKSYAESYDGVPVYNKTAIIGIHFDDYEITIEPAGQVEISIKPCSDIQEITDIHERVRQNFEALLKKEGMRLYSAGYHPKSRVEELPLIPKMRYFYMDKYFKTSGSMGANMMRGTASTQVSIDYFSQADFAKKYRVACILSPIIYLMTDNTEIFEGEKLATHIKRCEIWENVDDKRCGIVAFFDKEEFGFKDYAEYIYRLPLIFTNSFGDRPLTFDGDSTIIDTRETCYVGDKSFMDIGGRRALREDEIEHGLSMCFPDVRLKKYIEIRMADSMEGTALKDYLTFLKNVFESNDIMDRIIEKYNVSTKDIKAAKKSLIEKGYEGEIYGCPAREVVSFIKSLSQVEYCS